MGGTRVINRAVAAKTERASGPMDNVAATVVPRGEEEGRPPCNAIPQAGRSAAKPTFGGVQRRALQHWNSVVGGKVVELEIGADRMSLREQLRLKKTTLKSKKAMVIGGEFDVLDLYHQEYNPERPCAFDETSTQLTGRGASAQPLPAQPGRPWRLGLPSFPVKPKAWMADLCRTSPDGWWMRYPDG